MFTETLSHLYEWSVPACPVNIFLDVPLADRLRTAATASDAEIGGLLVGHFQDGRTIVTDFQLVESEHRRGMAYSLSRRDDQHLMAKLAALSKRRQDVVGFFRSHMRPGMFLDAADDSTLRSHFSNPQQVALLVKPSPDGTATGGFFFWEEGEMNRRETFRTFPMSSEELRIGPAFDAAQTLDSLPRTPVAVPVAEMPVPEPKTAASGDRPGWIRPGWAKIGLVAAGAALGGYYFGTSGSHEHFGSRAGDFSINDAAEPPQAPPPPAAVAQKAPTAVSAPPPVSAAPEKPVLSEQAAVASRPAAPPKPTQPMEKPQQVKVAAAHPKPVTQHAVFEDMVRNSPPPAVAPPLASVTPQVTPPAPQPAPNQNTGAFPHNPNPLPPPSEAVHSADASVDLEAVEDGGIKHALHKVPLFGALGGTYRGGQDFHPAQVIRRTTPRVPPQVARDLTAEVMVALKLKVDNTGRVSSVELMSRGSDRALVQLAGDAAYEWQFQPAQMKDRPVSSEVIAHFRFKPL